MPQRPAQHPHMPAPARAVAVGLRLHHPVIAHQPHQRRQHQANPAKQVEAIAPANRRPQIARDQQAGPRPDRHAKVIERHRQPQLRWLEPVRHQRCRRRGQRGFAHANQGAGQGHRDKPLGRAAGRGQQRPQRNRQRDQPPAVRPVSQHPHEQPGHRVEDDEEQPGQQAKLGIAQPQLRLDEIGKAGQQLAIDEVEHVDHGQQRQQPPGRGGRVFRCLRASRRHRRALLLCALRHGGGGERRCQAGKVGEVERGAYACPLALLRPTLPSPRRRPGPSSDHWDAVASFSGRKTAEPPRGSPLQGWVPAFAGMTM